MPVVHSFDHVRLKDAAMGAREHVAIGRLVRACAEIEDSASLFICTLINLTPGGLAVLLGQTAISKRLAIASYLAKVRGQDERYSKLFPTRLKEVIDCRNTVSHGTLLGQWEDGKWAFETTRTEASTAKDFTFQLAYSFGTSDLELYADWAVEIAKAANDDRRISALREERRTLSLLPSRKSQPKPKQAAKQKRPPRSSPA